MAAENLFILLVAAFVTAASAEDVFLPLVDADGFVGHYHDSETTGEVVIHVYARTTGFVGFAVAPRGVMDGADMFIGGCYPNGTRYFGDYIGRGNSVTRDTIQNVELLKCLVNATHTEIEWARKFVTGDTAQDIDIQPGLTRVIWSLGKGHNFDEGHSNMGEANVTLRRVAATTTSTPNPNGAWNAVGSTAVVLMAFVTAQFM